MKRRQRCRKRPKTDRLVFRGSETDRILLHVRVVIYYCHVTIGSIFVALRSTKLLCGNSGITGISKSVDADYIDHIDCMQQK